MTAKRAQEASSGPALAAEAGAVAAQLACARDSLRRDQVPDLAPVAERLGRLLVRMEAASAREVQGLHPALLALLDELESLMLALGEARRTLGEEQARLAAYHRAARAYRRPGG